MKKMLVLTLLLSSLPLMAEDVDYKHCASTMNEMLSSMNEFATMDDKGDFKIKPKASSMKNYGNSLGYKSFIMQKNKKKYEALDEETFEEWNLDITFKNPLDLPGYKDKISNIQAKTNLHEAFHY